MNVCGGYILLRVSHQMIIIIVLLLKQKLYFFKQNFSIKYHDSNF